MLTQEQLDTIRDRAGVHSNARIPSDPEARLAFALLEMLDWGCCMDGDAPVGVTDTDIRLYLYQHRHAIRRMKFEPPSYIGVLTGKYDVLLQD